MEEQESKAPLLRQENKRATTDNTNNDKKYNEEDWWSDSSSGSYYSDSCSSVAEWECEIESNGELFYIESPMDSAEDKQKVQERYSSPEPPPLTRRRSTRAGKLMRLIRRRESKRCSMRARRQNLNNPDKQINSRHNKEGNGNKEVTFRDFEGGEIREVTLWVDPDRKTKLGRRALLSEAYLGITPGTFSDRVRVMVAGFIHDGEAMKSKNIKIGDWLRSINSIEVTFENLENVLSDISSSMAVRVEVQRVAGVEVTTSEPLGNGPKQTALVQQLVNKEQSKKMMDSLLEKSAGAIYLKTTDLSENGPELQGVLYNFPPSENKSTQSVLCSTRGAFITLNHILPTIVLPKPLSTTILHNNETIHIVYTVFEEELLLIAFPEKYCCLEEAVELSSDIVRVLNFTYGSLSKCFAEEDNHSNLDHLFFLFFSRLVDLAATSSPDSEAIPCSISEFGSTASVAHFIQLPRDAQFQIDAALNEMEAMDYRDWNEDPLDCQRLYTIIGSCLYHKNYLLGSHLPDEDLISVHSFLKEYGVLNLVRRESVKTLVIWKQVYPHIAHLESSEEVYNHALIQNGKWFLLVVGYEHDLLAVILESGGCTAKYEDNSGPDVFYVEEAQETLKHIQKIGVSTIAEKWISSNARPEIISFEECVASKPATSIAENLLGFIKSSDMPILQTKSNSTTSSVAKTSQEIAPILKKRFPEENVGTTGSVYSLQTSEDSMSQGTGAVSEISDEGAPILGRRALRERNNAACRHSDDSDSDFDIYKNDSQVSSLDISDIRENLLNQVEYIVPKSLVAGSGNCLFQYVYLDFLQGVMFCNNNGSTLKSSQVTQNFNRCAHIIHKLLGNTLRFKKMLNQDMERTLVNKSLVAIKEHGVLFELDEITYWVVGRLYTVPHPRELYVCHKDGVPQNLIEMAFRLHWMWN